MASVHAILRKKTNKQGLHPVAICCTQNRQRTLIHTGQYLEKKHWDDLKRIVKKSHPNSVRLNNIISAKLTETNDALLEAIRKFGNNFTIADLKSLLITTSSRNSFYKFTDKYFKYLEEAKKYTRIDSEKPLVNKVKKKVSKQDISFDDITVPFLRKLIAKLKRDDSVNDRSIANILMFIRNMYNRAIDENLAKREAYPFGNGKGKIRIKIPESVKIGLTSQEIERIEALDLSNHAPQSHARNVWLFSFYLAGMRVADVIKITWGDIHDGRLYYRMNKNSKLLSLKITDKLRKIIDSYDSPKKKNSDYIFPELKGVKKNDGKDLLRKTKNATQKFNKHLAKIAENAEIDKKLTMHIARHSFGNISGDKIPVQMLQKLYRHSSITTTINYQANFINKDADDALEKVVTFK